MISRPVRPPRARLRLRLRWSVPLLGLSCLPSVASSQPQPEFTLAPPSIDVALGRTAVGSGGGSQAALLLAGGGRSPRLLRVDLATGKVADALEYDRPDGFRSLGPIWAWPGDSLAVVDFLQGALLLFGPEGAFARRMAIGDSADGRRPRLPGLRFLLDTTAAIGPGTAGRRTSASGRPLLTVQRYRFASRRADTVASYPGPGNSSPPRMNRTTGALTVTIPVATIEPSDTWGAFADGTIALIRGATYAIQLVAPNGTRRLLPSLAVQRVAIDEPLRKRIVQTAERGIRDGLRRSGQASRIANLVIEPPERFPDSLPHFNAFSAPLRDPLDRLWISVYCADGSEAACYDVIDRTGTRVVRLRLEENEAVIGFSPTSVIVLREVKDEQRVRLHSLP